MTTIAVMTHPYGSEEIAGFEELIPDVFEAAEEAPGFVVRAKPVDERDDLSNFERDWGRWGPFCAPRFYQGGRTTQTDSRASTLSIWVDLESVFRFTYDGIHQHVLRNKHRWFRDLDWRTYCAWWVEDDYQDVTWPDACRRLEHLNDHGASLRAFDFTHPFDPSGQPIRLSRPLKPPHRDGVPDRRGE
jgi:hypothetical protein